MTGRSVAAVAVGGALGALARYGLTLAWPPPVGGLPWATLVTNVAGCLAIGYVLGRVSAPIPRAFLGTGLLGGFTTFSAYAVETVDLADAGRPAVAVLYLLGTLAAALAAVRLGAAAARRGRASGAGAAPPHAHEPGADTGPTVAGPGAAR